MGKRIHLGDGWPKLAVVDQLRKPSELCAIRRYDEVQGGDPTRSGLLMRWFRSHRHQPTSWTHHREGALESFSTHGIKDQVHGSHQLIKAPGRMFDDFIHAQLSSTCHIPSGNCANDICTLPVRQLDRQVTHPTRGPMNKHPLTFGQVTVVKEPLPGRQPSQGN